MKKVENKRFIKFLIVIFIFIMTMRMICVWGNSNLTILYGNHPLKLSQSAILLEDTTYITLNDISKIDGFNVRYKPDSNDIILSKDNIELYIFLNSNKIKMNNLLVTLENPNFTKNGEIYVPLRNIFEVLLYNVSWDGHNRVISIS